ncbi:MAG: beta-lactamase family protein [Planctomycetes bacterium]|nr:beta-lactamase family protein [Planctomycetota bacterium]
MIRSTVPSLLGVLLATLPLVPCPARQHPSAVQQLPSGDALTTRVDEAVARALENPMAVGLSVGIGHGGRVQLGKGYGQAEREFSSAAGPATMFRIGSVTKQFTAALVMRLVEQGKVALDDPLSRFVPADEFATGDRVVTVRHLLDHTSGIPSYTDIGEQWEKVRPLELSHAELLALVAGKPFDFEPGQDWRYNNTGYYLLGMLLEKVHEKPYAQVVLDELCAPLGLERTRYDSNSELIPDRAQGYQLKDDALANDEPLGMSQPGAAGALLSTGGDLVRWSMALSGGKVVTPESFARMTTATVLPDGRDTGYGFGLMVGEFAGWRCVQHGGGINGFQSILLWIPDADLHVAVVSNSERLSPMPLAKALVKALLGEGKVVEDRAIDAELGQRLAGDYDITALELPTKVTFVDGKLMVQAKGQRAFRVQWQGGGEFVAEFDHDVRIVFGGDAQTFTLHQGGGVFAAKRVGDK